MRRGCQGEGGLLDTTLVELITAGGTQVTYSEPPNTTKQPPAHPGPANAAAWATTSCDVAGPSTGVPTTGRPPHNYPPAPPPRATRRLTNYQHHAPKRPCRHRRRHDGPYREAANHAAPGTARHPPRYYRTNTQTAHTQTGQNRTSRTCKGRNKKGVRGTDNTMVRHARRRSHPRTRHRTTPVAVYN